MNEIDIRKYAQLMQELNLTKLEFSVPEQTVRLERAAEAAAVQPVPAQAAEAPAAPTAADGHISVTSPMVGLFYAAPAESAEPYVSLGDRVKKGQTLCILEAMKLMNEICAEEDGVIAKICVTNGQMVDYGTELFQIRRDV